MGNNALPKLNTVRLGNAKNFSFYVELGVYIVLICNFFILLGNSQKIELFVSWPTRLMMIYIFLLGLVLFAHCVTNRKVGIVDAWFTAVLAYTAVCFVARMAPSQIVRYMCFVMLPACMVLYRRVENVNRLKTAIYLANWCYALLFFELSKAGNSHDYNDLYGIRILDELTLGYGNPNETGMYLMLSFIIMISSVFFWKKVWQKVVSLGLSALVYSLLWQTDCRMAILLATIVAAAAFLQHLFKAGKIVRVIVLLLPLISFLITILLPEFVDSLSLMDEQLDTGRLGLYQLFLSRINFGVILVGNMPGFVDGNLHNSYVSLVSAYGVLATVLYIAFMNAVLREKQKDTRNNNAAGYVAYVGALCVVAHGMAEAALIISGTVYAGMAGLLFLLSLPEEGKA